MAPIVSNIQLRVTKQSGGTYVSPQISVPALVDQVTLSLERPTSTNSVSWPVTTKLTVRIHFVVDGKEHFVEGSASGGVRKDHNGQDAPYYRLNFFIPWGFLDGDVCKRLGETAASSRIASIEIAADGPINTTLNGSYTESPAPDIQRHHSVSFVTSTSGSEEYGDGVVTVSNTASTDSTRATFVGVVSYVGSNGACTYDGGAMTEMWDNSGDVGGFTISNAGYYLQGTGLPTGAKNIVSDLVSTNLNQHIVGVINLTGVDASTPIGTPASGTGTASPSSVTASSPASDSMVVDCTLWVAENAPVAGAGQTTNDFQVYLSSLFAGCFSTQAGSDGGVMSWTTTSPYAWRASCVEFKAASSGVSHPYTGSVGVGAITGGAATVKARGRSPRTGGSISYSSATVKARGKVPLLGGSSVYGAASVYSKSTFAGNAYVYNGDGAFVLSANTEKGRGRQPVLGGAYVLSASTEKARGRYPSIGGGYALSAATERARGRYPTVGGSIAFAAGSTFAKATLYVYTNGGSQAYGAASEYEKTVGPAGTQYSYIGDGVLVFSGGTTLDIGRVYESPGGVLCFSSGTISYKTKAYTYSGLGTGTIIYSGATVYAHTSGVISPLESKPGLRAVTHEDLPGRPAGEDGAYTDPDQDGVWDEYPVDGAYTSIGYYKEFKPRRRWSTMTKEVVPS